MELNDRLTGGTRGVESMNNPSDKPLVSVITVVYNGEKHLEDTILSVIHQDCERLEYIIVDGGSDDKSVSIIRKYEDSVSYWVSERDEGIYDAMNKGIALARGQWLSFINCGDEFFDNHVLSSLDLLYRHEDLIIGRTMLKSEHGDTILRPVTNRYLLLLGNFLCHQSVLVRRSAQELFNTNYPMLADYDLWLKLLYKQHRPYLLVEKTIAKYQDNGYSTHNPEQWRREELAIKKELSYVGYIITFVRHKLSGLIPSISSLINKLLVRPGKKQ